MSFFNKKEEVLDVQLTQFGKYLLSKGKLKPMYYTFSDDEILYSAEYAEPSKVEKKKETSKRIQKDTQRIRGLYAYEGVETRVLKLNQHQILDKGIGVQERKTGKTGDLPVGELYGNDRQDDIDMHADEKNIVRNYIGHSTPGERHVPSWEIESLMGGEITAVNISSSTPNIGIKRPVVDMEIDYQIKAVKSPASDENNITIEQYRTQTGLEKQIYFIDNTVVSVEDDALVLSVVEEAVDYDRDNFEIELFVEEVKLASYITINGVRLPRYEKTPRRLYFADSINDNIDKKYAQYYFDVLTDHDAADYYGVDMFGTQRDKLKEMVKNAINMMRMEELRGETQEETGGVDFEDILDPCDPDDDGGFGNGPGDY